MYMRKIFKKLNSIFVAFTLICATFLFTSCESKINNININGVYTGTGGFVDKAIVENGTITIYSMSVFEPEVYWYGTCHQSDLNEKNILISERIESEGNRSRSIFDFGGLNRSRVREREILFTENSLTFVYDMNGMSVNQITLYKENVGKRKNDSNADELPHPETYEIEPSNPPKTEPKEEVVPELGEGVDI